MISLNQTSMIGGSVLVEGEFGGQVRAAIARMID